MKSLYGVDKLDKIENFSYVDNEKTKNENNHKYYFEQGCLQAQEGNYKESIAYFTNAISLKKLQHYYFHRARARVKIKEYKY